MIHVNRDNTNSLSLKSREVHEEQKIEEEEAIQLLTRHMLIDR